MPEITTTVSDDARAILNQWLTSWGLGELGWFITDAITNGWSGSETLLRLRETEEYKRKFPEMALRSAKGFSPYSEAEVLSMRDEVRRLTREYTGSDLAPDEVARIIASDKSLAEWETHLKTLADFERWGPTVRAVLEQELGHPLPDDRLFAFIAAEIATPELDRAYEISLLRGQPAALGLGIRPEEEAEILRAHGINPEKAFASYKGIAAELPRSERLAFIDRAASEGSFPGVGEALGSSTFTDLFRAIQLGDPEALLKLQQSVARETARFQGQGGAVQDRTGASVGLLPKDQR